MGENFGTCGYFFRPSTAIGTAPHFILKTGGSIPAGYVDPSIEYGGLVPGSRTKNSTGKRFLRPVDAISARPYIVLGSADAIAPDQPKFVVKTSTACCERMLNAALAVTWFQVLPSELFQMSLSAAPLKSPPMTRAYY